MSFPTAAQIAEDGGYPPTLVEALDTNDGLFAAQLRHGRKVLFGGAQLVGDGSQWIRLTGVPDEDLELLSESPISELDVDVRIDEILWCCRLPLAPAETEGEER